MWLGRRLGHIHFGDSSPHAARAYDDCYVCGKALRPDDRLVWNPTTELMRHKECVPPLEAAEATG